MTIGRQLGSDILLTDGKLSRRHVRLDLEGVEVIAVDLGSANGTRVNGVKLQGPRPLHDGDLLEIGESTIRLVAVAGAQPTRVGIGTPLPYRHPIDPVPTGATTGRAGKRLPLILAGFVAAMLLCVCAGASAILLAARGDSGADPTAIPVAAQPATTATGQATARPGATARRTATTGSAGMIGAIGGTFVGTVQLGYEITFIVSADGKTVSNVEARVLTRCNNKSTSEELYFLPRASFPVAADGSFGGEGRSMDGGPIYHFSGQVRGDSASGTLQEESAGGGIICDTKQLTWEATRKR